MQKQEAEARDDFMHVVVLALGCPLHGACPLIAACPLSTFGLPGVNARLSERSALGRRLHFRPAITLPCRASLLSSPSTSLQLAKFHPLCIQQLLCLIAIDPPSQQFLALLHRRCPPRPRRGRPL
jgi:hypothetical protein